MYSFSKSQKKIIFIWNFRETDMNGRASSFFDCESDFDEGVYKLTVNVKDYYTSMNKITFFPYIDVSHNNVDTLTKN